MVRLKADIASMHVRDNKVSIPKMVRLKAKRCHSLRKPLFVSIPKMVRLKACIVTFFPFCLFVSIPKMVRLKVGSLWYCAWLHTCFNSKNGAIKSDYIPRYYIE